MSIKSFPTGETSRPAAHPTLTQHISSNTRANTLTQITLQTNKQTQFSPWLREKTKVFYLSLEDNILTASGKPEKEHRYINPR